MTLSMLAALTPTAVIVVSVLVPLAAVLAVAVALVALLGKKRTSQGGAEPQPVCRGSEAEDVGEKEGEAEESGEPVRAKEEPSAHEQPSEQAKEQSPEAAGQPRARETAQDEPDGESVGELPCEGAGIIPEESAGEEEERTPDGECGEPLPEREVTDEGKAGLPYGADDDAWEDFVPGGEWSTPSLREVFACEEEGEDALPLRPRSELEQMGDEQRQIFFLLSDKALMPDEIVGRTEIPARRVNTALTLLQAGGYLTELPGRRFTAAVRFPDTN